MENLLLFVNIGVKKSIFRAFFSHDFQVLNRIENLGSNSFAHSVKTFLNICFLMFRNKNSHVLIKLIVHVSICELLLLKKY